MDCGMTLREGPADYAHGEQGQLGQQCRQDTQGALGWSWAEACRDTSQRRKTSIMQCDGIAAKPY